MASRTQSGSNGSGSSTYATKRSILQMDDLETVELAVPEWDGEVVRIRELTGGERGTFDASISKVDPNAPAGTPSVQMDARRIRTTLVALTLVDESGKRIFTDNEIDVLASKSAKAIGRIYDVSARLSGLSDEAMEEIAGESTAVQESSNSSSLSA